MTKLSAPVLGAMMTVAYTGFVSSADGVIKLLAGGYAAAQIYVLSGAVVALLSVLAHCYRRRLKNSLEVGSHRVLGHGVAGRGTGPASTFHKRAEKLVGMTAAGPQLHNRSRACSPPRRLMEEIPWRTACPRAMGLRSLAALCGAVCFFYAFRLLPFAQVFLYIGLMPLLAGVLSGVILKELISFWSWIALALGFVGVMFLFPGGVSSVSVGHVLALLGTIGGTLSMVLARYISQYDTDLLPQVFYPNLLLCVAMLPLLPFVWHPMSAQDLAWALSYGVLLFAARWLAVAALRLLPAYVVTPLMNLQFIWMLMIGSLVFGEMPAQGTGAGGLVVICSGLFLLWRQGVKPPKRQRMVA